RHQALQRTLVVEQRIAAGQEESVWLRFGHVQRQLAGFDTIHPQAPSLDDALFAQLSKRAERALASGLGIADPFVAVEVPGDVVNPHEVQAIDTEALEAVLDRA